MATLSLDRLTKRFGATTAIKALSLDIANGEFVVLVGPSGCGKSTLLRMIAGLETISEGDLRIDGKRANDLPPQKRNISMVFQSYALFPHMSVYDNIAFGPEVRGEARDDIARRIEKAAGILNLSQQLDRRPAQLSGGQRQRVAMGRAIVRDPAVFLFDEPLSNLDAKLRVQMRTEIKSLHQALKTTIVYVTHDQIEAMTMADRIVVMNDGRIEQTGAPLEIYDRPANRFVAEFIGSPAMGILEGRYDRGAGAVRLDDAEAPLRVGAHDVADGARVAVGIRPESFARRQGGPIRFDVEVVEPTGPEIQVFGRIGGTEMRALFRDREIPDVGQALHLDVAPEHVHLFDADTGARL